jgi:uncharacterized iron-regulated protein
MQKHIIYLVFCFLNIFSNAQSLDISNLIPNNNKIIILGEAHRIKENYPTQLELIKLLHKSKRINCLIIEKSSSSQVIIDNLIRSGDTSGIYYLLPKIMCDIDSCVHDLNPYKDFIIELTSYSKANNLPIFCLDIDENYQKTK